MVAAPARLRGATIALTTLAALLAALILGLRVPMTAALPQPMLRVFNLVPPPPPRPVAPPRNRPAPRARGAEGAAGHRAEPTPIVAPPPVTTLPPPPVITSAVPDTGLAPRAGAANVDGLGPGAGGEGLGRGGGGRVGTGDDDDRPDTPPRLIKGRLGVRDLPDDLVESGVSGTVGVRYSVETDGSVGACTVERSSGSAALDALTCRVIHERFRFRPSLDPDGRPVRAMIVERHSWVIGRDRRD